MEGITIKLNAKKSDDTVKKSNGKGNSLSKSGKCEAQQLSKEEAVNKYTQQIQEKMRHMFDPTNGMSEEKVIRYKQKVLRKLYSGKKLSAEEMQFIRANMPELYPYAVRVQMQRQALYERMKHCRSKEEVQDAYAEASLHISKEDPAALMLQAAYADVKEKVQKTEAYKNLPDTKEEAKKLRQQKTKNIEVKDDDEDNNDNDNEDVMTGSDLLLEQFTMENADFSEVTFSA